MKSESCLEESGGDCRSGGRGIFSQGVLNERRIKKNITKKMNKLMGWQNKINKTNNNSKKIKLLYMF